MNLTALSDGELLSRSDVLVARERDLLTEVLHHLREIERRRLFSELGYKSLFDYAVKRLGYADDQAARRISAMRLLKELPEIEQKISDGSLTLTNIGMAQVLFRHENYTLTQKTDFLKTIEGKSKREAQRIIATQAPEVLNRDRIRTISDDKVELKFSADRTLEAKLNRLKGLLAHTDPNINLGDLVDKICDIAIEKLDPAAPALKRRVLTRKRREVWRISQSKCSRCGSEYALEIDHEHPRSKGGTDDPENLRLLCRNCNQREAINKLGIEKMSPHLS